jgi:hypothetical protein
VDQSRRERRSHQPEGGAVAMATVWPVFSESGMWTFGFGVREGTMVRIAESSATQVCPHSWLLHWKYISRDSSEMTLLVRNVEGLAQ